MRFALGILALAILMIPATPVAAGSCMNTPGAVSTSWSPDARYLAATLPEAQGFCASWGVAIWNAETGFRWVAAPAPFAGFVRVSWAPDSTRVLASSLGYTADVKVINVATGTATTVAKGADAAWSPGGHEIAYAADRTGVHIVSAEGTSDRRVAAGDRPAWSPDGSELVYHRQGSIHVARNDGAGERRVAEGQLASWFPGGSWIAVTRDEVTYRVRPDGSDLRPIGNGRPLQWSRSGQEIVLNDGGAIRIVSVDGMESRTVAEDAGAAAFDPRWERLATVLSAGRGAEIFLSQPSGARPRRISGSLCHLYTARCVHGTDGRDRIVGSAAREVIFPGAGDDRISSGGGDDRIDTGYGRDYVDAGAANDIVSTQANDDVILGGRGIDMLSAGNGEDRVWGGPGRDTIDVRGDGRVDVVACGPGSDSVYADPVDRVARDCETVRRS